MSLNQSRADKSESSQYRKSSRSGSFNQQRNSGGRGKGGGGAPGPPTSWSPSLSSNQSFKKSNNAQGGQSRTSVLDSNADSNNASADRIVQNGAHFQPPLHGAAEAPLIGANVKPTDVSTQKSTRPVPKVPSSNAATVMSDTTAPTTPAKAPADASKSFPLQFGSISPGFMNGMQIPARTSSAPPNLDEQKRDQARHDLLRAGLTLPMPSIPIPKQQLPRKDAGTVDNTDETHPTPKVKRDVQVSAASHVVETQKPSVHPIPGISMQIPFHQPQVSSQSNTGETNPTPKMKRDVQVSVASSVVKTQKPSVHPIPGVSLQIPFHQPHVPIQFGGSSPQIESQGMTGTSLPMPMPLHLQMGNPPQVQQPVFVPGLQPHPMQTQGIMHQGHGLNFSSSMGPQLPSQLGNLGIGITQQFAQQQAGNFGSIRKTVKITHPDTHEELRLDGSSGQRSHPNVPPIAQPIPSCHNASSNFFPAPSSLPPSSTPFTPISQAPRFYNQVSQGPPTASFIHSSALNSFSADKTDALLHGIAKPSTLDHSSKVRNITSPPSSTSIHVTVKPAAGSHGEKAADTSPSVSSSAVEKILFPKLPRSHWVARSSYPLQDFEILRTCRAQTPVQYVGGILSGPVQSLSSQGGVQRNGPDSDRWQRATSFQKDLRPSPHTPSQVMHKAEKKYEVGKVTDEEQGKQRQVKGILKKLTPQNFEKLFEQVKQVKIDNAVTLTGVVSQIFDKALMEPTFCEMYANLCSHLAGDLPDLNVGNEKITFKRLLLNKCQEEFERGEREQEEANKAEEEVDVKQSEQEREEKRIWARRRMLGNIRLIGELYKKKMLTERIMHECIKKLLGQPQDPDEEDVEALCELMSTIGVMIDHPKAKVYMDAYFDMMATLSNSMKLSSRVRFMLKDAIDLRKNNWQQRRKVEGPKKIEEVHGIS